MSKLQSGVRFRALPEPWQAAILMHWIGCQRHIYNQKVEEDRLFASIRRLMLRSDPDAKIKTPLDRLYAQFKCTEQTPWLSDVPSQVLREGTYRWHMAKQRQLNGLAKAPRKRSRKDFNSVLLASDLFHFSDGGRLCIGTDKFFVGELKFKAHREFAPPKMLTISMAGGRWFVSFSYEHEVREDLRQPHELAYELDLQDDQTVAAQTIGVDRNVADNCIATSRGEFFLPDPASLKRIGRKATGARRHQRRLARSQQGSANRRKLIERIARKHAYKANVLRDFAHKTSHALAESGARLIVFEDLKIQSMVRRPEAKQDESGRWMKNGSAAKAGLNKAILSSAWGRITSFTEYKAARRSVIVAHVPPNHTSQQCSQPSCGHTAPENRQGAVFLCKRCGFSTHADLNASANIASRGIALLRSGGLSKEPKASKRAAVKRRTQTEQTGGPVRPPSMSVEHSVRRSPQPSRPAALHDAVKQKRSGREAGTPTTAQPGV